MRWPLLCSVFLLVTLAASSLLGGSSASADAVERTVWEQRSDALPATAPTPRIGGAVAYDSVRNRLVLYGGYVSGERTLDDTWEWDGHAWERKRPSTSPGPRTGHAMVFDSDRARVVLVGGGSYSVNDSSYKVWEWDGTDWTARSTNDGPGPVPDASGVRQEPSGHAMAYDAARKTIVFVGENNTWELSGDTWTYDLPFTCPGGRPGCLAPLAPGIDRFYERTPRQIALTYDSSIGRTLLFDNRHLWQWTGSEWTSLTPDAQTCHDTNTCDAYPESRFGALLIFDPARGRTVLYGGSFAGSSLHGPYEPGAGRFGDTWEWDGTRWTKLAESSPLGARSEVMGAYDTAQQKVLLFGGNGRTASNDLWSFQGVDWQLEMAATSPAVRAWVGHAIAYDPVREEVVLFGGRGWTLTLGDTWVWNGRSWSERKSETSPAPRVGHRMVFDRARGVMVMFGGQLSDYTNSYSVPTDPTWEWADTWEWNGQTWTRRQVANAPTPRSSHGMTYDEKRHVSVMYGGGSNETWEWNGENWSKRTPLVTPGVRSGSAMTYDTQRERAVMYGGGVIGGFGDSDIWEWDGATWTELTPASAIPPRNDATLVFHRVRGMALLFGGSSSSGGDDTWEWNASELVERVLMPRPPAATGQAMAYDERRVRAVLLPQGAGDDLWEYHAVGGACSADTECDEQMCVDGRCHSRGDALSVPDHTQDAGVEDAGTVDEEDASSGDDVSDEDTDDSDEGMDDSEALDGGETRPDDPSDADAGASASDDSTRTGGRSGCSASSGPDGGALLGSLLVLGIALQRRRRLRRSERVERTH